MSVPVIGVTSWRRQMDAGHDITRTLHTLGVEYVEAIHRCGGAAIILVPTETVTGILDRLDGLLLAGGEDLHPATFGEAAQSGQIYDRSRDRFELELITQARERRMPALAICRGLQVTNVAFGGSLVLDLPATDDHTALEQGDQWLARHSVTFAPECRLAQSYGAQVRRVNTIHHQAIATVAPGFDPVAWAPDGTIEAIESRDDWDFWGVQWHPEKMLSVDERRAEDRLFRDFVRACSHR